MTSPLDERLARLRDATDAARSIGLEAEAAAADGVAARITDRSGFGGDTYVMALAGGTGVGKSSLLNALAGREVSAVRATRPTTDEPLAFVAESHRRDVEPLLEWLGVRQVVGHADGSLAGMAVLDLPDVDSVRREHRATVDALLPRIDALAWVVDPEKYDDERLHEYWRSLVAHGDRMHFVLNKMDRLGQEERSLVASDLARRLEADGLVEPKVSVVSATTGDGVDRFREQLAGAAEAKALVAAKLETDRRAAISALAQAVGVDPATGYAPLLDDARHAAAVEDAVRGGLALVDPRGVAAQVHAALLYRARSTGGSFLGRAVALLGWMTGQRRRRADPAAYLLAWRRRGSLGRVLNPIRAALTAAAAGVPPESRRAVLAASGAGTAEAAVERALDEVARREASQLEIRSSLVWSIVGVLQLAVGAVFLFAVAWYVTLFLGAGGAPVATVDLLWLGPVPMPLALLAGSVVVSAILGWLLGIHAGFVGRRRAARVADRTRTAVRDAVTEVAFAGLRRVEDARTRIAAALPSMERDTGAQ